MPCTDFSGHTSIPLYHLPTMFLFLFLSSRDALLQLFTNSILNSMSGQLDKIIDTHEIYDQHELQRKKAFVSPVWRVLDGLSLVLAYLHFIGGSWVLLKVTNLPKFCRVVSFVIYFLVCTFRVSTNSLTEEYLIVGFLSQFLWGTKRQML